MVRIAVISDIHFGIFSRTTEFAVPGQSVQDETKGEVSLKEGLIDILKEMHVEYLFIAGDLTSVASPQEFYYCKKNLISIADEVGIAHDKILCCLGNHDIDRNITKISDEAIGMGVWQEVEEVIREKYNLIAAKCAITNMESLAMPKGNFGPAPYSGIYDQDEFIVFVLNSGWLCAHDQDYPHGKLEERQLAWFEKVSDLYKNDQRTKFVLLHHHPFKYSYPIPSQDISMLEEGSEFMDIVKKNKINIVIHGHRHHPIAKTIQIDSGTSPLVLVCAGSLSVNSAHRNNGEIPNTMHILELNEADKAVVLYNYKYLGIEGWRQIEFCNQTPLDYKMKLGKIFSKEQIEAAIKNLPNGEKEAYQWDELDECLQYIVCNELNSRIENTLSDAYKIVGKFPNNVVFLKKEGKS